MARKAKFHWSMKSDRELIRLVADGMSLEALAARFDRPPETVAERAKRLGIHLKPQIRKKSKA
jgi:hypothetical protein